MSLTASRKEQDTEFVPVPEGTHAAICRQVIDLGHQWDKLREKWTHKVTIGWELPLELREDGKPHLAWSQYTVSLSDRSYLYRDLVSWRGRKFTDTELESFELITVVGAPCMLTIVHNIKETEHGKRTYANVTAVTGIPKGMDMPKATTNSIIFDIDNPDQDVFETFGDHMKLVINSSKERTQPKEPDASDAESNQPAPDDDVPF